MQKLGFIKFRAKHLIYAQLFWVCTSLFFITEIGLPSSLIYATDIITCFLFLLTVLARVKVLKTVEFNYVDVIFILFLIYALFTSTVNGVNFFSVAWACRTTFRFYIFYYCCIALLGRKDVSTLLRMLEVLFAVNAVLVIFEYFVQGLKGDYLGGMFGIQQGANGFMNFYVIVMLSYEISRYLKKDQRLSVLAYYLAVSFIIASLAEIKFLYIEIIVLVACALIMHFPTRKTACLFLVACCLLFLGLQVLKSVFPSSYTMLLSGEGTSDYLDAAWTGGCEMGRTTAIQFINSSFFSSRTIYESYNIGSGNFLINQLFGFGFGAAEPSSLVHSRFADQYSSTQYAAFEFADRYLELGWIGLCLYVLFFLVIFVSTFDKRTHDIESDIWFGAIRLLIPLVLMNVWYGNFRIDASYMIFFFLAIPRIASKRPITSLSEEKL